MAKGENIFKRKDGRWEARYIKGHELSGKIRYGFCYGKTYKEAKEKVTKCKAALAMGGTPKPASGKQRFAFYCDEWLRLKETQVRESTLVKYRSVLEKHVKPKLGGVYPLGFSTEFINEFSRELLFEEGLSPKSVRDILMVVSGVLKHTAARFPGAFPVCEVNYPKVPKKEMRVLSREEQERFVSYMMTDTDECKFGLLLALFTGVRIGELCALKWENISVEDGTVRIVSSLQRLQVTDGDGGAKTHIVIGQPKSDTSKRVIPMTEALSELCRRMRPEDGSTYVLTGTEEFMDPRVLQYRIEKYTGDCDLKGVHCHTLRHTFATRAVEVGFEIKSLSEVLGHATTSVTLERYVHSSMELKRSNMNKLAAVGL